MLVGGKPGEPAVEDDAHVTKGGRVEVARIANIEVGEAGAEIGAGVGTEVGEAAAEIGAVVAP
jgi:hypothetical protein